MNQLIRLATGFALFATMSNSMHAQKTTHLGTGEGGTAHVRTDWTIVGANISITYGQPNLKGRPEAQMMPVGKPWRAGADVATVLKTDKALKFETVTLQPGSYTINAEPGETSWTLMIGKLATPDQWGIPYQPNLEIARVPMKLSKNSAPVESLSFLIEPWAQGGTLHLEWGTKNANASFTVVK